MKNRRTIPQYVQVSSIIAACLAIIQISLGGVVIVEKLHALLVTIHLAVGLALFSMTLVPVLYAYGMFMSDATKESRSTHADNVLSQGEESTGRGTIDPLDL